MNLDQIQSLIRTLLAAGGPIAALLVQYGVPADKANIWLSLGLAILPPLAAGIWGIVTKTDKAKLVSVGAMPGVTVAVGPTASPAAQAVAADPTVPNVAPVTKAP